MAAKRIDIPSHARFQMRRRRIKRADVVATIRRPGQVLPSAKGRQIYQSRIGRGGRMLLRAIVKEDARAYHVVTVYKTRKVAKYWRTP
jgi:hypothetical protein